MGLTRNRLVQTDTSIARIQDPITVLNSLSTTANADIGFLINRDLGLNSNVAFIWNEANKEFRVGLTSNTGINDYTLSLSSYANLRVNNFYGNLSGSAQDANVFIATNLTPTANAIYELGSPTSKFRTIWLSGPELHLGSGTITSSGPGQWTFNTNGNSIVLAKSSVFTDLTLTGNLTVQGTQFVTASEDTSFVDSIIDLHTYANLDPLLSNDGRDIGFKFHYYDTQDSHAFLGRANDTGYLEWYDSGDENSSNVFVGTSYGTIKSGGLWLVNTSVSTNTTTGALRVAGGVGIGGALYIANTGDVSANIGSIQLGVNVINANLGAYQLYANANAAGQQTTINSTASNVTILQGNVDSINANLGAYQSYANANAATQAVSINNIVSTANANTAAYLLTATGNIAAGNVIASGNIYGGIVPVEIYKDFYIGTTAVPLNRGSGSLTVDNFNTTGYAITANSTPYATNAAKTTVTSNLAAGTAYVTFVAATAGNVDQNVNTALTYNPNSGNLRTYGLLTDTGVYWASNGVAFSSDTTVLQANIDSINANLGAYQTYANANASTQATSIDAINANLGSYQTFANANAATQATSINSINANLGAYQVYANANIGTIRTNLNTLDANVGAYQIWSNANAATQATSIDTINANLGAYQIYANANLGTATTNINSINANLGAYQIYANANLGTATTNISSLQANLGAYQIYANANIGTIKNNLSTLDANVGAFEIYANANLGTATTNITNLQSNAATQQVQINNIVSTANANTAAYLPTYSGSIGGTLTTASQPNITTLSGLTSFGASFGDVTAQGNLTVVGNLTIQGNTLTIGSNNLTVVDSIIDLHTYANLQPLTTDDGRDIGFRFHYYKGADTHAFFGWENDTQTLIYLQQATEGGSNVSGTYGNVQFGSLLLSNTNAATSTTTGAFQVRGGAGIAGNVYADKVYATNGIFWANGTVYGGNISSTSASTFDNAIARFDGTTGKLVQGSTVAISDTGQLTLNVLPTAARETFVAYNNNVNGSFAIIKTDTGSEAAVEVRVGSNISGLSLNAASSITTVYSVSDLDIYPSGNTNIRSKLYIDSGIYWYSNGQPYIGNYVTGPASSTNYAIPRFNSTTGNTIQNSNVRINDTDSIRIGSLTPIDYEPFGNAPVIYSYSNIAPVTALLHSSGSTNYAEFALFADFPGSNELLGLSAQGDGSGSYIRGSSNLHLQSEGTVKFWTGAGPTPRARFDENGMLLIGYEGAVTTPQGSWSGRGTIALNGVSGSAISFSDNDVDAASIATYMDELSIQHVSGTVSLVGPTSVYVGGASGQIVKFIQDTGWGVGAANSFGTSGQVLTSAGLGADPYWSTAGNVVGSGSSLDNTIVRFDGTSGALIQNSNIYISDSGQLGINFEPLFNNEETIVAYNNDVGGSYIIAQTDTGGAAAVELRAASNSAGISLDNVSGVTSLYSPSDIWLSPISGNTDIIGKTYSGRFYTAEGLFWAGNDVEYTSAIHSDINLINANVGAYQLYANANAATQATSLNSINANIGSYQTYANANAATQATSIDSINANLGAYQLYANANIGTIKNNLSTLDANVGAYQTYANANAATQATSLNSINANIGAFYAYANTKIGTNTNSNLVVNATTTSTSATTGALVVKGGVGVAGNVYADKFYTTSGLYWAGNGVAFSSGGGGGGLVYTTSSSAPLSPVAGDFWYDTSTDTLFQYTNDSVNQYWLDIQGVVLGSSSGASPGGTGTPSGADTQIQYNDGGTFGGAGNLTYYKANGNVVLSTVTSSTSSTTGALVVTGGVGIGGNVYVNRVYTTAGLYWSGNGFPINTGGGGGSTPVGGQYEIQFNVGGSLAADANLKFDQSTGNLVVGSNTASHSTTTGAVVVRGGAGVTGNVYTSAVYADTGIYWSGNNQPILGYDPAFSIYDWGSITEAVSGTANQLDFGTL